MKRMFGLMLALLLVASFSVASAAGRYVYYLDSEGDTAYTQKEVAKVVAQIQEKLPAGAVLTDDDNFYVSLNNIRIDRQASLMQHLKRHYPYFEELAGAQKCKLMPGLIEECFRYNNYDFDGVVVVQIIPLKQQLTMNTVDKLFGTGGIKNQVEMMAALMVYDRATNQYVYTYNEEFDEKISSADWSPVIASKKIIPLMLKHIDRIAVE